MTDAPRDLERQRTAKDRIEPATAIYRAIMVAIEDRRQQLGLPMWQVDELAGTQDGFYAKALHVDSPSGRQSRWETLQLVISALYPEGFDVEIRPAACALQGASSLKTKLRHITARYEPKTRRELMAELGKRGRQIQLEILSAEQRSAIARKGQRTRRKRRREKRRAKAIVPGDASREECRA